MGAHLRVGGWLGVLALAGCQHVAISLEDRSCIEGECIPGWVCDPRHDVCTPAIAIGCGTVDSFCPETVVDGDACPSPGAFLPCSSSVTDCSLGCRTCDADSTWSACDDGGPTCAPGTFDADHNPDNGCECTKVGDGTEICDGLDDDCNGTADEVFECVAGTPRDCDAGAGPQSGTQLCHATACDWSGTCFPKDQVPPAAVADLTASAGEASVEIGFTVPDDADLASCVLRRDTTATPTDENDGTPVAEWDQPTPGSSIDVIDQALTPGVTYYYAVFCVDASGNWQRQLGPGNSGSAIPTQPFPVQVADAVASDGEDGQVTITFTAPGPGIQECVVMRKTGDYPTAHDDPGATQVDSVTGAFTDPQVVVDQGLLNGETYYYAVFCRVGTTWNDAVSASPGVHNADTGTPEPPGPPWWDCNYGVRQIIAIGGNGALPAGYSVSLVLPHLTWVQAGEAQADGSDVRVISTDGATNIEVDRVLDPESAWNTNTTVIWAAAPGPGQTLYVYHGASLASAPLQNEGNVFPFADFFERPDDTAVGNAWSINDTSGDVNLIGGALVFSQTDDIANGPFADHDFAAMDAAFSWRFRMNWVRSGGENDYQLMLQLGDSASMNNPPSTATGLALAGLGPSFVWTGLNGGAAAHETLRTEVGGVLTDQQVVSGSHALEVDGDLVTGRYALLLDGATVATGLAMSSNVTQLDRVRFLTSGLNDGNFSGRLFDYVIVRDVISPEPNLSLTTEQTRVVCP